MTFETQGKFLQGLAGDFLVHIESAQKCLNTLTALTGATGASALKGNVWVADGGTVIAPGGVFTGADQFVVAGPKPPLETGDSGSIADPYTILDVFDGAVLNESVLLAAGYDGTDLTAIKGAAAFAGVKWVSDPIHTEQKGGTPTT